MLIMIPMTVTSSLTRRLAHGLDTNSRPVFVPSHQDAGSAPVLVPRVRLKSPSNNTRVQVSTYLIRDSASSVLRTRVRMYGPGRFQMPRRTRTKRVGASSQDRIDRQAPKLPTFGLRLQLHPTMGLHRQGRDGRAGPLLLPGRARNVSPPSGNPLPRRGDNRLAGCYQNDSVRSQLLQNKDCASFGRFPLLDRPFHLEPLL